MNEARPHRASIEEATLPVVPEETGDDGRNNVGHEDEEPDVVFVLPADNDVAVQVGDISDTRLATGLDEHPSNV